ncbi:MAG: Rha family transcriptional regulator [Lachnospiraceae bacterium]|nr:Rha family transcriptional regulator [Lachnospiraceae bacterium]
MYELVEVRKDDVFTNSKVIAEGTQNQHESIVAVIQKYEKDIADFGRIEFSDLKSGNPKGGRPERMYYLNEEQATFVITLLRNSKVVVKFKKELVRQFYAMRRFLIEKQSKLWNDTRLASKENRLKETDVIKLLVEYAKEQGSTHSDQLYRVYTKLANSIVGGKRDDMTASELNTLTLVESIIKQTIEIDMSMGMHYKDIYKDCKARIEQFGEITYLIA